jgi:hypothetical protein
MNGIARWCVIGGLSALIGAAPRTAAAQQTVSDVLTFLVTNQGVQTGNPQFDLAAAQATSDTIARALLANIATLPITSSSGAFVYGLNPELGTVQRTTESFGPFFVERALTVGRHRASIAFSAQHLRFTSLDGRDLRDGTFVTTANRFPDEAAPFDVDQLKLAIDADIATIAANVGVTDRLEVGVAVPMVSLRLDGARVNNYRGTAFTQASATASAIGTADMVIRSKYTLAAAGGTGAAAAVDVRLPTGRREDLLGTGSASVKFSGIGSVETGHVTLHGNAGVSFGGLARELSAGGAITVAASNRLTLIGELLTRRLDSVGGIVQVAAANPRIPGVETIRLAPDSSSLTLTTIAPGVKWNLSDTWVLSANVRIPLTNAGLYSPFTPFVSLDYAFGR